ncbi:hypothetical protein GQ457_10G009750 [Hibiscus cannabinus]
MNSFVPLFPEITHKRGKPGENHNFDFGLLESVVCTKVSSRPLRSSPEQTRKQEKSGNTFPGTRENRTTLFPEQGEVGAQG